MWLLMRFCEVTWSQKTSAIFPSKISLLSYKWRVANTKNFSCSVLKKRKHFWVQSFPGSQHIIRVLLYDGYVQLAIVSPFTILCWYKSIGFLLIFPIYINSTCWPYVPVGAICIHRQESWSRRFQSDKRCLSGIRRQIGHRLIIPHEWHRHSSRWLPHQVPAAVSCWALDPQELQQQGSWNWGEIFYSNSGSWLFSHQ